MMQVTFQLHSIFRGDMMKILICDFPQGMNRNLSYETELLRQGLPGAEVKVMRYQSPDTFRQELSDTDALLTAFLPLDEATLASASQLKFISVNATGCNTIDLAAVRRLGIHVANVDAYCTGEVADHTMALLLALTRQLKAYDCRVQANRPWSFRPDQPLPRLAGQKLAVFGFGKIAQAVVKRAQAFDLQCLVVSRHLTAKEACCCGVRHVSCAEALQQADILSNHMKQTADNVGFFSREAFQAMKRQPIFLNVGRGEAVDEAALAEALDQGLVRAAGLDVFAQEGQRLAESPFLQRANVILTPHAAFYSEDSLRELQRLSCQHILWYFRGELDRIHCLVA